MIVRRVHTDHVEAEQVSALMDENAIEWHSVDQLNWKESYPYAPEVKFRVAHNGGNILVEYRVNEETIRAVAPSDNGRVWEDSCCEMFLLSPAGGTYYNFECNCAATLLIEYGTGRGNRERADAEIVRKVKRWSSNGNQPFDERMAGGEWRMALVIPVACLFKDKVTSLSGLVTQGNFYKCGDKQRKPHFLSWHKIVTETPDFHRPDFFGRMRFE